MKFWEGEWPPEIGDYVKAGIHVAPVTEIEPIGRLVRLNIELGKQVYSVNEIAPVLSKHRSTVIEHAHSKQGRKLDDDKPRYHLMPRMAESEIVQVLTYGAMKYDEQNWRKVTPLNDRYYSAARRHMAAFMSGETHDEESGRHHLAHAACCLLFMLENDMQAALDSEPVPAMLQRQAD